MQMNPIGWVEIPVNDLDRAEKFYKDYFGLECDRQQEMDDGYTLSFFPMDMKAYGSAAALSKGPKAVPSHDGPLVYFTAPGGTVDAALQKAEEMGISIVVAKQDKGGHGFIAEIEDSEGNLIAIHSMDG